MPKLSNLPENINRVFTCESQGPSESRAIALQELQWEFPSINTPAEVVDALSHGMVMWE